MWQKFDCYCHSLGPFDIEIGTEFRRCSDCNALVRRFRDFLDGNVIEDKGSCTQKERNFCYEDYF